MSSGMLADREDWLRYVAQCFFDMGWTKDQGKGSESPAEQFSTNLM